MPVRVLEPDMAGEQKGEYVVVRMRVAVAKKAKIVAAFRDVSLGEYISDALEPVVDADLAAEKARDDKPPRGHKSK